MLYTLITEIQNIYMYYHFFAQEKTLLNYTIEFYYYRLSGNSYNISILYRINNNKNDELFLIE